MADTGGGNCCWRCCNFIIISGLAALFLWLSLRPHNPTCTIQHFYLPALNKTNNSTNNHSIYLDLKLQNGMKDKGVHYANINLTFSYTHNSSRFIVANYTVPEFYQGHGKKTSRKKLVAATGLPWKAALEAVANGSTVGFRVDLATRVKFKIIFWFTKRRSLVVGGDMAVDDSGGKVKKKGIKLKSGATDLGSQWMVVVGHMTFWAFLILFNY